jgi:hypothetical protein
VNIRVTLPKRPQSLEDEVVDVRLAVRFPVATWDEKANSVASLRLIIVNYPVVALFEEWVEKVVCSNSAKVGFAVA